MILALFGALGSWFGGFGKWLKDNPAIAKILLVLALIWAAWWGKKRWEENIEKGVRRIEREKYAREQAEAQAAAVTTISENSREYINASERVRSHDVAVQLPNERGARLPDENYRD